MKIRAKINQAMIVAIALTILSFSGNSRASAPACAPTTIKIKDSTLTKQKIAQLLGWVESDTNRCGGYYVESPFTYPDNLLKDKPILMTSDGPALFARHGTSIFEGHVTATQIGQQITANKAYLYRDPVTNKLIAVDLFGAVHLREPGSLVLAKKAHLDIVRKTQSLDDILYRTEVYSNAQVKPNTPDNPALQKTRTIIQLSAWGKAKEFFKSAPKIYEFHQASYSTCPPNTNIWKVKASQVTLNKNTGRGNATDARLYIKGVPVLYTPYFNFPIDDRRQTGFLPPIFGSSNKAGPYLGTPFYWNLAPNYDTTITPSYLGKRGLQVNDLFRYLTPVNSGRLLVSVVLDDKAFSHFQTTQQAAFGTNPDPIIQANLERLERAGSTRGAISWQNKMRFDAHWSGNIDYNRLSDDYYLQDLGSNLANVTAQNQLLQEAAVNYSGVNWTFTGRIQQYQTLHPVDQPTIFQNPYSRFPQLIFEGNYPDQAYGLKYTISNELTHFDLRNTPGTLNKLPMGNRFHTLPGVSLPLDGPFFFVTPRIQLALTQYELGHVTQNNLRNPGMGLPIYDITTGLFFDRDMQLFGHPIRQTLEPQLYYAYVPFHDQSRLPVFDTTLNTLNYDQLFTYNRFSGLDRVGDANQVSLGLTTRFIDSDSGIERIRAGIGEIIYFENRQVTLCTINDVNCPDAATLRNNRLRRSPVSGVLDYHLNANWKLTGNTIWNTQTNEMDNQSITLQYQLDSLHILNVGYNFVRNGDIQPQLSPESSANNLKQIDVSLAWPVMRNWSVVGRWTQSINQNRFLNLLSGLQYDSCCWAVRMVAARTFLNLDANNVPQYDDSFYIQFALKGLGNFGPGGDPSILLGSSVAGFDSNFGQDF